MQNHPTTFHVPSQYDVTLRQKAAYYADVADRYRELAACARDPHERRRHHRRWWLHSALAGAARRVLICSGRAAP